MGYIGVTLFCIPLTTAQHVYSPWIYGEFLCKAIGFMQGMYVEATVLTIVCMSLERYLAIRHPMRMRTLCDPRRVKQIIVITWVVAIITMCPLAMYKKLKTYDVMFMKLSYCIETWPSPRAKLGYELFLLFIVYIIPGFLVVGLYTVIGCSLWTQDNTLQRANSMVNNEARIMGGRRKLARMMIVISILFAVCWLPYFIINLCILFSRDTSIPMSLYPYALLLGHAHSAQNPILYFFMHRGFHDFVWRLIRCQCQQLRNNRQVSFSYGTIDRCVLVTEQSTDVAIRHPMRMRTLCDPRRVKQIIVITWVVAIITMCPLAMYKKLKTYDVMFMKLSYCIETWPSPRAKLGYELFLLFIVYIIPGFLVVGLYTVIGCSLWTQDNTLQRANSMVNNEARIMGGRRKLARMMIVISILFAVCWLPYFIINLCILFSRDTSIPMSLYPYALLLGHAHSAQNPILYFFMHRGFHDFVWRLIRCQCQQLRNNRQVSVSSYHHSSEKTMMTSIANGNKYSYRGTARGRHV